MPHGIDQAADAAVCLLDRLDIFGHLRIEALAVASAIDVVQVDENRVGILLGKNLDTTLNSRIQFEICNRNAANSQVGSTYGNFGWTTGTVALVTSALDTTASVDLTLTCQLSDGAETAKIESYIVEVLYGP